MKKMFLLIVVVLFGCSDSQKAYEEVIIESSVEKVELSRVILFVNKDTRLGSFYKNAELENSNRLYLHLNEYFEEFSSDSFVEELLISESAKIFKKYSELDDISIKYFQLGEEQNLIIDRDFLEIYIGYSFYVLSLDDGSWNEKFEKMFVENVENRKKLFYELKKQTNLLD